MGVAVGDYDNDGWPDLFVTSYGNCILYRNNRDGTFTDVTSKAGVATPGFTTSAVWFDYDNDGKLDLFVCSFVDYGKSANRSCGENQLGRRYYCIPRYFKPTTSFLYHNNGDGTFKDIGFPSGTAVNENGSEQGSMGVTLGDYDHDGKLDLFITNFDDDYNTLYHNDGHGSFTDVSYPGKIAAVSLPYVGWGTKFIDYDSDGWVDLLVINGHVYPQLPTYKQRNLVHHNNHDGTFSEVGAQLGAPFAEKRTGRGAAFGDIDNDGDVDVIINNLDGAPQLLRNDGGNTNNSVLIKTIGVKSNRDGIGARVIIVSGDLKQVEDVHSGGSYISQNDLRLHFGLETRTKIDLIEVRWPSGAVDKITGASANKILTIKEGQGLISQKDLNRGSR